MRCYLYMRFLETALFDVEVESGVLWNLKRHNRSQTPAVNSAFFPPFSEEVRKLLEDVKIVKHITELPKELMHKSILELAEESFRHYHGVKIVLA